MSQACTSGREAPCRREASEKFQHFALCVAAAELSDAERSAVPHQLCSEDLAGFLRPVLFVLFCSEREKRREGKGKRRKQKHAQPSALTCRCAPKRHIQDAFLR
uniref:Uncharacterized protein n=1 Tax=Sphaerodactylus townsendi TaxID=933632 RepID=A0ACB8FHR3_9SAUR